MGTDGFNVFWNDDFVAGITEEETRGVLAHEVLHVIFKHCAMMEGKDPKLCNVAMDWAINLILREAHFRLPEGALFDPSKKTAGWAWEEIYRYLDNIQKDQPDVFKYTPGNGGVQPSEDMKQKIKEQISNSEEHVQKGGGQSASEREEYGAKIDDMVIKASNAAGSSGKGSIPGDIKRRIKDIREPKIHWAELLHKEVKSKYPMDFTFRKPNRKFLGDDLYLPSMDGEEVGPIVIGFDSSGSVTEEETRAFIGEANSIINDIKPSCVYLMSADYRVANVEKYGQDAWFDYSTFETVGGGGTSFQPVFQYVEEHQIEPDQLIYFSDMCVSRHDYPSKAPLYPVIFVGTRNTKGNNPFGTYIKLEV